MSNFPNSIYWFHQSRAENLGMLTVLHVAVNDRQEGCNE